MLSPSIRQLEYVLAVAQHGSVSVAAQAIHISQPALSVAITNLESHLGRPLFIRRKGSPLTPTAYGRTFIQQASQLMANFADLTRAAQQGENYTAIVIGCFEDLAPLLLGQLLAQVKKRLPSTHISIEVGNFEHLSTQLTQGKIDLAVSYDLGIASGLDTTIITQVHPHVLLYPQHPLCQKTTVSLSELSHQPLILVDQNHSIWHMQQLFRQQGLQAKIQHHVASYEIMRSMVANGLGLGLSYTRSQSNHSYDGKNLVTRPLEEQEHLLNAEPIVIISNPNNPLEEITKLLAPVIKGILKFPTTGG
jgi:DNA-binding transcriptional LysR family regulator